MAKLSIANLLAVLVLSLLLVNCEANNCTAAEAALTDDEDCVQTFGLLLDGTTTADLCEETCRDLIEEVLDCCDQYPVATLLACMAL